MIHFQLERAKHRLLEASAFDGHIVVSNGKEREVVETFAIGIGDKADIGAGVSGRHFRCGDDSSAGVSHRTGDGRGDGLAGEAEREAQHEK